ncbi:MAG: DUF1646 domain-containing protein [Spirochaetia bacterium]|nr:DUF1646 domain-containing protein [Spirochaetia bacterium]
MLAIPGLFTVLALVLILPFLVRKVEEELEIFLFIMGVLAVTITSQWSMHLAAEALIEPIKITAAVLVAGLLFRWLQLRIARSVNRVMKTVGVKLFVFGVVVGLGLLSSIITAIVAALVLVEIVGHLKLDKKNEIRLVIITCFSIGMGAALTPIGEPLSTIAIAKLKGPPHNAGFWYLLNSLWLYIIPGIIALGLLAAALIKKHGEHEGLKEDREETFADIFMRTGKVYLFVMALVLLGTGFKPLIDEYVSKIPFYALYWINMISAVLDNATLVAAEVGPHMSDMQVKSAILGLIIAGGMLIPGNIPNIISAGKLKISSKEWAKFGMPLGLVLMTVYFVIIIFLH